MSFHVGLHHYLIVATALFVCGIVCVVSRRNAVALLMGIELILNAANVNLAAFSRYVEGAVGGDVFVLFVIALAAAEAAIALAIVLAVFRTLRSIDTSHTTRLKG